MSLLRLHLVMLTLPSTQRMRRRSCTDAQEQAATYATAKQLFWSAHEVCPDPASSMGFQRVGAKTHPDMEWTFVPEGQLYVATADCVHGATAFTGSGMGGGGIARHLKEGVVVDAL